MPLVGRYKDQEILDGPGGTVPEILILWGLEKIVIKYSRRNPPRSPIGT